jgi:O-succinylbenzoate synthase
MKEMAERHNMIQEVLVNAVRKHRRLDANENWANEAINFDRFKKEMREPILGEETK